MLEAYLTELNKIVLLTPEEERALWQAYKEQGDTDSRQRLIVNYQPLVFKQAMRLCVRQVTMDLLQEGTVGLIEAVEGFDHTKGIAFSVYAQYRIRGRMLNYLAREGRLAQVLADTELQTLQDVLMPAELDALQRVENRFVVDKVLEALRRLPVKEQLVLSGVYLDEQPPGDLAAKLDISLSHVYRLQKQGIRRMRGMLARLMAELKGG